MFRGTLNPTTGRLEWVEQDRDVTSEECDISPELARSQYGDMLHDRQRNRMYYQALKRAVARVKASGREPHVLDIGTGTGLLAMMAAKAGATRVTACEVLRPMVRIARQVIARNGYGEVIQIVPKRSTEMTSGDMPTRANILVTEVFDTELIGEGALVTFAHAHKHLLERGCIVIPSSATVYIRLIHSKFLWRAHKLDISKLSGGLRTPPSWSSCPGHASLWDLHVEEIKIPEQMTPLSETTEMARFPFWDPALPPSQSVLPVQVEVTETGFCHGVVVWWSLDFEGTELNMDPWNYQQWRDHWLQAVQLLPVPMEVHQGDKLSVGCYHDDYSMWFTVNQERLPPPRSVERPVCTCRVHTACSRTRISMLNDPARNRLYTQALTKALAGRSTVVCVSDGCLLPLLLAKAAAGVQLYSVESSPHSSHIVKELLETNGLSTTVTILEKLPHELTAADFGGRPVDAVVGEPHFSTSLLPWHNLHFWYACSALRGLLSPDCVFLPNRASLKAIAVNFDHMYKLRAPVGTVEGFDISAFDKAVGKHSTTEEGVEPEPHPLWEYPSHARSDVCELMNFDLTCPVPENTTQSVNGSMVLNTLNETCHGVVLWMDYQLTDEIASTTGLLKEPDRLGEKLQWDPCFKQAVYFLPPNYVNQSLVSLKYSVCFNTATGQLELDFTGVH